MADLDHPVRVEPWKDARAVDRAIIDGKHGRADGCGDVDAAMEVEAEGLARLQPRPEWRRLRGGEERAGERPDAGIGCPGRCRREEAEGEGEEGEEGEARSPHDWEGR